MRLPAAWVCWMLCWVPLIAWAQDPPAEPAMAAHELPSSLMPWVGWAEAGQAFRQCPLKSGGAGAREEDFACMGSGVFQLKATEQGWAFRWAVARLTAGWVPLPSQGNRVAQIQGHAVVLREGQPVLWLEPGTTELVGTVGQSGAPLSVPEVIGPIVASDAQGKPLAVQREGNQVTVGETTAPEQAPLQVQVWRQLTDTVPRTLTTRVMLQGGREGQTVDLGAALPAGFTAQATEGPVTITPQGTWRVAVGQSDLRVIARCTDEACAQPTQMTLAPPRLAAPWPATEIWSLQVANDERRSDWKSTGRVVDAAANAVPDAWRGQPAVALQAGQTVSFSSIAHPPSPSALTVRHTWTLDADRAHWISQDEIGGTIGAPWRLTPAPGSRLGQVSSWGRDQVINQAHGEPEGGIPWGTPAVALQTVRTEASDHSLSAVGWQRDASSVRGTLLVPTNVRVLHVSGPDQVVHTWVSDWDLFQVFLGALLVGLIGRVLGWQAGVLAGAYVALATPSMDTGAPFYSLALVVALAALWQRVRTTRWQRPTQLALIGVGLVLLIQTGGFVRAQWEGMFHPQMNATTHPWAGLDTGLNSVLSGHSTMLGDSAEANMGDLGAYEEPGAPSAAPAAPVAAMAPANLKQATAVAVPPPPPLPDAMAVAPSPAGLAAVELRVARRPIEVSWDGPVRQDEVLRVWWLGPLGVALWRAATLATLVGLLVFLVRRRTWTDRPVARWPWARAAPLAVLLVFPGLVSAQATPDSAILTQMAARLNTAPRCAPDCARWRQATVAAEGQGVTWTLQADADQPATLPVPQPGTGVTLDGGQAGSASAIFTDAGQAILVPAGTTTVTLHYQTQGPRWNWTLGQPGLPVTVTGTSLGIEGLREGTLSGTTLTLVPAQAKDANVSTLRPYVQLERTLSLTDRWRLTTTATLVGTPTSPLTVVVPLLPDERAVTAAEVSDQGVRVTLRASQPTMSWSSELPAVRTWRWKAPTDPTTVTRWTVVSSPWWQTTLSGVALPTTGPTQGWSVTPFPGQTLTLTADPLSVRPGSTVAVDRAALTHTVGQRMSTHDLQLTVRAHGAQTWPIQLPPDATLIQVKESTQGTTLPLTLDQGRLVLPLTDGVTQWAITFREPTGQGLVWHAPAVGWHAPTNNGSVDPGWDTTSRWILAASGPGVGPSITLWSHLAFALLLAWGLSRLPGSPLRWGAWAGLSVGLVLASDGVWLVVAGFLLAMELKGRRSWGKSGGVVLRVILALWAVLALSVLIVNVGDGLLSTPHTWSLEPSAAWMVPSSAGGLPSITVWSAPMWVYRTVMLGWSLWLAWAVLGWGRRAFRLWMAP